MAYVNAVAALSAVLSRYSPTPDSAADTVSIPTGESLCAIGPAKCRSTNIIPDV